MEHIGQWMDESAEIWSSEKVQMTKGRYQSSISKTIDDITKNRTWINGFSLGYAGILSLRPMFIAKDFRHPRG